RVKPVEICVTVTSTPGSAAPDSSTTTPDTCAMATVCAAATAGVTRMRHSSDALNIEPPETVGTAVRTVTSAPCSGNIVTVPIRLHRGCGPCNEALEGSYQPQASMRACVQARMMLM